MFKDPQGLVQSQAGPEGNQVLKYVADLRENAMAAIKKSISQRSLEE
jgi:hypothetical protein